jgi:hypothetical protein
MCYNIVLYEKEEGQVRSAFVGSGLLDFSIFSCPDPHRDNGCGQRRPCKAAKKSPAVPTALSTCTVTPYTALHTHRAQKAIHPHQSMTKTPFIGRERRRARGGAPCFWTQEYNLQYRLKGWVNTAFNLFSLTDEVAGVTRRVSSEESTSASGFFFISSYFSFSSVRSRNG